MKPPAPSRRLPARLAPPRHHLQRSPSRQISSPKELTETELRNVWYVQIGHVCQHQKLGGKHVVHENHVYIDVYETYPSAEHQRAGLHGTVSKVQIRCTHSGVDYPCCSVPIDVTAVAKGWAVSCQQADIWNKHVSYIESTASFMYQTDDHHPVPVQHASSIYR